MIDDGRQYHGFANWSAEYNAWTNMKQRCYNVNHHHYKYYGERGIKVCERWRNSFTEFILDLGMKPGPEYSLGRIDNDGDYEPTNCRWETPEEQANNQRHIDMKGEANRSAKLTNADVAEIRRRYSEGEYQKDLAKAFGVVQQQISNIVTKLNWNGE